MALGAQQQQVLLQVVRQGLTLGLIGVAVGVSGAFLLNRFLEGMLFGVSKSDPSSLLVTGSLLTLVSVLAAFLPALRAMRVEPVRALRYE
jgi:ABC-type antimicrobial peptide transport system permease subunit